MIQNQHYSIADPNEFYHFNIRKKETFPEKINPLADFDINNVSINNKENFNSKETQKNKNSNNLYSHSKGN